MKPPVPARHTRPPAAEATVTVPQKNTLLICLIELYPHINRKILKSLLQAGKVQVDGQMIRQFNHPVHAGQQLSMDRTRPAAAAGLPGIAIIFEDQQLIVINKPPGLLTVATDKEKRRTAYALLSAYVKQQHPANKIFIVHRLDRETSGLLLFARDEETKRRIQDNWNSTIKERSYVAVVEGKLEPSEGVHTSYLRESKAFTVYSSPKPEHGDLSVTHYRRLAWSRGFSLVDLHLETGRKHQIRVHMQDLGHPVAGDAKYGAASNPLRRLALHARVLAFVHPVSGQLCHFETPVPPSFQAMFSSRHQSQTPR